MTYFVKKPHKQQSIEGANAAGLVTFDQFYEIVEENVKAHLLDGKIIRDSPGIPKHGFTMMWIGTLIHNFNELFHLGEIGGGTTTVRLSKYQGPEPDLFFVRTSRLGIVNEKYIDGAPDLCVEVISKSTRKIDRGRKFVLYADHGVKEYWIIDPLRCTIEFYQNQDGEWLKIKPDAQDRLHSKVLPGLWLKTEWFSSYPLPPVFEVLQEILGKKINEIFFQANPQKSAT
jgi:Uma2 family endonuclease